jgi:tetratricopeptide (TPR) repeat protein
MSEHEIWNELGDMYFNTGAYHEAIRLYQKAIALDHANGQSYNNLAAIYVNQENYPEAIRMLQRGIESLKDARDRAILWNQLGEIYRKMEDYDNAMASYRKAAELDPGNSAFQDNLAEMELNDDKDVLEFNSETSEETDTVPEMLSALLDTLNDSDFEQPAWVFKNEDPKVSAQNGSFGPIDSSPKVLGSRLLSGKSTFDSEPEESEPEEKVSTETNQRMQGLLWLAIQLREKGEPERALQFLKTAVEKIPGTKDPLLEALCYHAIAVTQTDLGEIAGAIQSYQSAASLSPDKIFPWNTIGKLNCLLDRYEDALAAYREALEHNPKDAASWNGLGDVYHNLGRNEEAIAAYQFGNVYEIDGTNDEDPLQVFERTMQTKLETPKIWDEAGNIFFEAGAYEEAISSYRRAIELDPANSYSVQADLTKAEQAKQLILKNGQGKLNTGNQDNSSEYKKAGDEQEIDDQSSLIETRPNKVISAPKTEPRYGRQIPIPEAASQDENDLPATIIERDPDAPYWLFNQGPALDNPFQPTEGYSSAAAAPALLSNVKALSMLSVQPTGPLNPVNNGLVPTTAHPNPLFVQLPPKPVIRTFAEGKAAEPSIHFSEKASLPGNKVSTPSADACTQKADTQAEDQQKLEQGITNAQLRDNQPAVDSGIVENDISAYRRVTDLNPGNDRAWDALGNMYEALGKHSEAIEAFEHAIALSPDKEAYYFHLGNALAYQEKYDAAIAMFKKVLALNQDYLLSHCALAANYRRIGKNAEAQAHIAIARPSMESESDYNRACFESISGNVDLALEFLKSALESQQTQPAMARSDPDLDFIRDDPRFEELLQG